MSKEKSGPKTRKPLKTQAFQPVSKSDGNATIIPPLKTITNIFEIAARKWQPTLRFWLATVACVPVFLVMMTDLRRLMN